MNLKIIQHQIDRFTNELKQQKLSEIDWLYEKQFALDAHHMLTVNNIESWMAILFSSDRSQRYWTREEIRSAELLRLMTQHNADMVSTAFRDLFDEHRDLEGRVDRFKFYMDEMIAGMRRNSRKFLESWHHQDNSIISYYLMMQYPDKYCYYQRDLHVSTVKVLGAKPLDVAEDFPRYQKMINTLSIFIFKDEALINAHLKRFTNKIPIKSRLLVYEYLLYINDKRAVI